MEDELMVASRYTQPAQPFEEFLSSRCHSLLALAQYLRTFFPGVSYGTRQNLLLDAEKAKAVQKLWQIWSARLELQETHERGPQIFESVVKDMRREATGEAIYHDVVREWFRNDVLSSYCIINVRLPR
jgi:Non-repetitive/WGA-negative nucleoporin C-terminal